MFSLLELWFIKADLLEILSFKGFIDDFKVFLSYLLFIL